MRNRHLLVDPKPEPPPDFDRPSKSQRKRDMTALQDLGREIAALSPEQIRSLDLPERLADALIEYRTINAHEGARRQMQFIGKLMRGVDPAPLQEALERFNGTSKAEVAAMHAAERWRERLLEDAAVVTEFASAHPGTDLTRLRTLIRNAAREKADGKPPRDYRELYRAIRAAMADATAPTEPTQQEDQP